MVETTSNAGHRMEDVVGYRDGLLAKRARAELEAHLAGCAACKRDLEAVRGLFGALDAHLPPAGGLTTDEILARMARKEAELRAAPARPGWRAAWAWAASGLTLVAGASAALLLAVRAAPLVEPSLLLADQRELAPSRPTAVGQPPPPLPPLPPLPALAIRADVRGRALELEAPREPGDRYALVALIDARRGVWRVRSGMAPDPTCAPACGAIRLRIDLAPLPPGPVTAIVAAGPAPLDEGNLPDALLARWPPRIRERAIGRASAQR